MNVEELREYCINKKGVTESFPFDKVTLVFKVMDKMFALTGLNQEIRVNLKCDPEKAIELREAYSAILPGYHMNKTHWNTVVVDGTLSDKIIEQLIDDSYNLIVSKLTKKKKQELFNL